MTETRGIYTLWLREIKRYLRDRTRIISSFFQPLLWLVIFGSGIRISGTVGTLSYQQYIFPGIIGQTLLFTSMFMGISVIWDREFGFLKEILVAPHFTLLNFSGEDAWRQHRCCDSRNYRFRSWLIAGDVVGSHHVS